MRALKGIAAWALRHGRGGAVVPLVNLAYRFRAGPRRRFSVLPGKLWVNSQDEATLAGPEIDTSSFAEIEAMTHDYFEHDYQLCRGDNVVDVGAGIGTEAVIFAREVGPDGRVLAIEAHPQIFQALQHSVRLSSCANVTPVHAAVSDRATAIFITDNDDYLGNFVSDDQRGIRVMADTLDSFVEHAGLDRIDLLKMNIEGAEVAAIRGMSRTIAMTRNVAIACHDFIAERGGDESTRSYAIVEAFLHENGFAIVKREDDPRPWIRYTLYGSRPAKVAS